jgi:hypothetical protein
LGSELARRTTMLLEIGDEFDFSWMRMTALN